MMATIIGKCARILFEAGAIAFIAYLLFFKPEPTAPEIEVVDPPKTEWKSDPRFSSFNQLQTWALSPLNIDYTVASSGSSSALIKVHAWDTLKSATTTWKISYPRSQELNFISISAGIWYDSRAKPFWAPAYYRKVAGAGWIGAGPVFEGAKTLRGGMICGAISF
jgi:hypothetical protein